jgi:hypothetical protein
MFDICTCLKILSVTGVCSGPSQHLKPAVGLCHVARPACVTRHTARLSLPPPHRQQVLPHPFTEGGCLLAVGIGSPSLLLMELRVLHLSPSLPPLPSPPPPTHLQQVLPHPFTEGGCLLAVGIGSPSLLLMELQAKVDPQVVHRAAMPDHMPLLGLGLLQVGGGGVIGSAGVRHWPGSTGFVGSVTCASLGILGSSTRVPFFVCARCLVGPAGRAPASHIPDSPPFLSTP